MVADNQLSNQACPSPHVSGWCTYSATTASPTASPTAPPTSGPTSPLPGPVGAKGGPHLMNIRGQRFDLGQPGRHALLRIPKLAHPRRALLAVDAEATQLGAGCDDLYFTAVNVTGAWARHAGHERISFTAGQRRNRAAKWMAIGKVALKVVHGSTGKGTRYLNVLVKWLSTVGMPIGGLLGEDDHTYAAKKTPNCKRVLNL